MMKQPAIYMMSNFKNGTLYVGVTSNLVQRVFQHKEGAQKGFTRRYGLKNLVYFEIFDEIENAIFREKQLKGGSRAAKIALIEKENPLWVDLYGDLVEGLTPRCDGSGARHCERE